ncbi:MAG: TetR family transcriptional regulator C-terminal domain-containing protein [Firmicutes bacterium]|nr:TetR family transcriptional regulator C-terminal domain-containing protein [Bacillota bacterium]
MKENQRIGLTKRLLKETLLRLLKKKDLNDISITELCRESEINRATFYRHYALPKDVLLDIQKDFINEMYAAAKYIKSETDAEKYLVHLCLVFYEHSTLVRYFTKNNLDNEIQLLLSKFFQRLLKSPNRLNAEMSGDDAAILNTYLVGGAYSVLRQWLKGEIHKTPEEIAQITLKLINGDFLMFDSAV